MADTDPSSLILSALEVSSDLSGLLSRTSSFLLPFADLLPDAFPKKAAPSHPSMRKKSIAKSPDGDAPSLRSVAKRFLPFLSRALTLLPSALRSRLNDHEDTCRADDAAELFGVYRIALDCLRCIEPCLSGKPHWLQLHRARLVRALEDWGRYGEAEEEAMGILESLAPPRTGRRGRKAGGKYLPVRADDPELAVLMVEIVTSIVGCSYKRKCVDEAVYDRAVAMCEELQPWMKSLEGDLERSRTVIANALYRCSLFVVGESVHFESGLVRRLCVLAVREWSKSGVKDQLPKVVRRICSSLDLKSASGHSVILDMLQLSLESMLCECQINVVCNINDWLETVCCLAEIISSLDIAIDAFKILSGFCRSPQDLPPVTSIMTLYAIGLKFSASSDAYSSCAVTIPGCSANGSRHDSSTEFGVNFKLLATSLEFLASHFHIAEDQGVYLNFDVNDQLDKLPFSQAIVCRQRHGKLSLLSYFNSLEFLCKLFEEFVTQGWKQIVCQKSVVQFFPDIAYIQDLLHQFADLYFTISGSTKEHGKHMEKLNLSRWLLIKTAIAALKVTLGSGRTLQKSVVCLKSLIFSKWINSRELKFLSSSLYNVGASLYNTKRGFEASVALKLCCSALWSHVKLLCNSDVKDVAEFSAGLCEDAIKEVIVDAIAKSASTLDVLYRSRDINLHAILVESLSSWAAAEDKLKNLISPRNLVRQWVKIRYKDFEDDNTGEKYLPLYSLLSSHGKTMSKRSTGMILEEELSAYEDMATRNPNLCSEMQKKVIDVLLDIYVEKEFLLPRARILVRKGKISRASGIEGLDRCIQCLSEAISLFDDISQVTLISNTSLCHQLAITYCLHAQSVYEAGHDLKIILDDVCRALDLWSNMNFSATSFTGQHVDLVDWNTIQLLCNISDLMSLKGCLEIQFKVVKLIISFWQLNGGQIEKCFSLLWTDRRLSHALCLSPINDGFFEHAVHNLGIHVNAFDFWLNCLNDAPAAIISLLQKLLLSDCILPRLGVYSPERFFGYKVTVADVEAVASSLASSVSVSSHSDFAVAYLYHDLAERLILGGRLIEVYVGGQCVEKAGKGCEGSRDWARLSYREPLPKFMNKVAEREQSEQYTRNFIKALKYAKESLHLRRKILHRQFIYLIKQQPEAETFKQKTWHDHHHLHLEAVGNAITKSWPASTQSENLEQSIVGPWNLLRCYLESTLQVGSILDLVGDGIEAVMHFSIGKKISDLLNLSLCKVSFMSQLGKVHLKEQLWDMANEEFIGARLALEENSSDISCKYCKLTAEATIDLLQGDLSRFTAESSLEGCSAENASDSSRLYRSSLGKLTCDSLGDHLNVCNELKSLNKAMGILDSNRRYILSGMESKSFLCCVCAQSSDGHYNSHDVPGKTDLLDPCSLKVEGKCTRGAKRKCKNSSRCTEKEKHFNSEKGICHNFSCSGIQNPCSKTDCSYSSTDCFACLFIKAAILGSMQDISHLKWECYRRRLMVKVYSRIAAQCPNVNSGEHNAHDLFLQSMSTIFMVDPCNQTDVLVQNSSLLMTIDSDLLGDIFSIERAVILYDVSWFFVKNHLSEKMRNTCCCLSDIQLSTVLRWLFRAFIVAKELPSLVKKVSQLLATLFVLSSLRENYALPLDLTKSLSSSHWAAYFHQASVGTYMYSQYLSGAKEKNNEELVESFRNGGSSVGSSISRTVTDKLVQLEEFVRNFFASLPDLTCICITFLGGDYIDVLREALLLASYFPAWMLLSRFDSKEQPSTIILPLDYITEDSHVEEIGSCHDYISSAGTAKVWECPWGCTVVDSLAPSFKQLLEENYVSLSSMLPASNDIEKSRFIWWSQRTRLNNRLSKFLRNMEDSWLGAWRCLLIGRCFEIPYIEKVLLALVDELKCKCNFDINWNLLRVVADGVGSLSEAEECVSQLLKYGGFLGRGECCGEGQLRLFSSKDVSPDSRLCLARSLILEAIGKIQILDEPISREPLVLILDTDIQMLPWENLPVLRRQEVYRMPSLASALTTLQRCNNIELTEVSTLPLVDPTDAYYLLNPSGDLCHTQAEFEEWFKKQKWEGKAGNAPTKDQLVVALQNHDLFVYFGHGSGTQYIPGYEIRKLSKCAATLLMGCSSGCLFLKGQYAPQGTPLNYLLAGSPVIIANLWDVSDKDIDRFGKAMLNFWLDEETDSASCNECNMVKVLESIKLDCYGSSKSSKASSKTRKVSEAERVQKAFPNDCLSTERKERITAHMCQARDSCKLPVLIGASPVCYGVPTFVRRKG